MSLLMEALRKAEEAKRKIQNQDPDASTHFSRQSFSQPDIAPIPVVTASLDTDFKREKSDPGLTADYMADNFLRHKRDGKRETLKPESTRASSSAHPTRASVEELQSYLETTPEIEEATPVLPKDVPARNSPTTQQRAAGSVFAAKQKPAQSHSTRNALLALLALLVPLGAGILWYLTNSSSSSLMLDPALLNSDIGNRSVSDAQIGTQPEPQALQRNPDLSTAITAPNQNQVSLTDAEVAPVPNTAAPQNAIIASEIAPAVAGASVAPPPVPSSPAAAANLAQEQATAAPETTFANTIVADNATANTSSATKSATVLEVSHNTGPNNNNQQLLDAYTRLQAGDFAAASTLYQQVLEQFPNNRDALLGSAAIALRDGNVSTARELYSRLMQLNPKDPFARTGLLQTIVDIDPLQYEQELQRLLQQFPEVAPLSFALGNVYATQQRWNEAQSAYFDAFLFARQSNEASINPDYAYNLAVSLEQINQPDAALDYYRQAQTLANGFTPGFDSQALSRRITFLEQNRP
jgi:Flp pilus assembly protein TadD